MQSETYMRVLSIIEEIQRIPAQAGPQSPGCLTHTEISRRVKGGAGGNNSAVCHICVMDISFFITPTFPVPKDG